MAPALDTGTVAVVGIGNMGAAVAERLLDAGRSVRVFNRTAGRDEQLVARGAERLESAAEALATGGVCLTTLADDDAVRQAVCDEGGILRGARPGGVLVEMSTISPAASAAVAEVAAEAGVRYLRAPISGNPGAVRAGTAAIFVSGPAETAAEVEDVLRGVTDNVRYVGDGERARVLKLVLQVLIGGTAELLAEALVLGEAAGIERRALLEVIGASVVGSTFVAYKTEPLLRDDYSATFTTAMMKKDVDLVLALADETRVELPFTTELRSLLEAGCTTGYADRDFVSLVAQLQERARELHATSTRSR